MQSFEPCPQPTLYENMFTLSPKSETRGLFMSQIRSTPMTCVNSWARQPSKLTREEGFLPAPSESLQGMGNVPRAENSASCSPHTEWICTWASQALLSSGPLHQPPSLSQPWHSQRFLTTLLQSGEIYFSIIKRDYKSHYRKLGNDLLQFDQKQKPGNSRFVRLCINNQCPLIFKRQKPHESVFRMTDCLSLGCGKDHAAFKGSCRSECSETERSFKRVQDGSAEKMVKTEEVPQPPHFITYSLYLWASDERPST